MKNSKIEIRNPKEARRPKSRADIGTGRSPSRIRISFSFRFSVFGFVLALLGGGFATRLHAGEPSTLHTTSSKQPAKPHLHAFTQAEATALLTATLQRDYVQDNGKLELNFTQPWQPPLLPDEPLKMKILEMPNVGITPSFIVRFQICTTNRTLGVWQTSVQAHLWQKVWVAHSNLQRGEPVGGADLVREKRDILNIHDELANFSTNDSSLQFSQYIPAGVTLLSRMVQPLAVIHRGQMADALVQEGTLRIKMKVQALQDGAPGQMIRARNPISQRYLTGRVLDAHTIRIYL